MADQTAHYALPLLQSGQAQKEVTHNSALAAIDSLLHLAVASRLLAAPAASASPDCWIVAAGAIGAWSGRTGQIAVLDAAGWSFVAPRAGCLAFVRDEGVFAEYSDDGWSDAWPVQALAIGGRTVLAAAPAALPLPSGDAVVDAEARSAIAALTAALQAMGLATSA